MAELHVTGDMKTLSAKMLPKNRFNVDIIYITEENTPNLVTISTNTFDKFKNLKQIIVKHDKLENFRADLGRMDLIYIRSNSLKKLSGLDGIGHGSLRSLGLDIPNCRFDITYLFMVIHSEPLIKDYTYIRVHPSIKLDDFAFDTAMGMGIARKIHKSNLTAEQILRLDKRYVQAADKISIALERPVFNWEESDTLPTKWMDMCRLASKRADETGDTEKPKRLLLNYLERLDIPFLNDKLGEWQNLSLRAICTNLAKLYDTYRNKQEAYNKPRRESCKNTASNLDYSDISDKNIIYYLNEGELTFCFTPEEIRLIVNRFKTNLHTSRRLTDAELEDMKRWLDELYVSNNDGAPAWLKKLNKEEEEEKEENYFH